MISITNKKTRAIYDSKSKYNTEQPAEQFHQVTAILNKRQ